MFENKDIFMSMLAGERAGFKMLNSDLSGSGGHVEALMINADLRIINYLM